MTTALVICAWPTADGYEATVNHFGKVVVTARRALAEEIEGRVVTQ